MVDCIILHYIPLMPEMQFFFFALETATGGLLLKKGDLKNFAKFTGKHL